MENSQLSVPVKTSTFLDLADFLREVGSDRDPVATVDLAIRYWIDNASWKQADLLPETVADAPSTIKGYMWKELFLPHGTHLRMKYRREFQYAQVSGDKISYQGRDVSPAEFANKVTGTSRNAWRDIWVKRPGETEWQLADNLRARSPIEGAYAMQYRDDILDALIDFGGYEHRSKVIEEVGRRRMKRGDTVPPSLEQTVQQAFERHCGESDIFCGRPELDLFRWPEGKGRGYWAINEATAEKYLAERRSIQRGDTRRIPSAYEL